MINLLPPDVKDDYRYARRNTRLIHWVLAFGFGLLGLTAVSVGGVFYLHQQAGDYNQQVASLQATLQKQDQAKITKQVTETSNNLKLAIQVLSKEVLYSRLLAQLATIIPSNAALASLNLGQSQGALDISASTADYTAATQLQVNLADPSNKLFSKADIVNISCASGSSGTASSAVAKKYPCSVTIRALYSPNNPYLFIGNSKQGTKR